MVQNIVFRTRSVDEMKCTLNSEGIYTVKHFMQRACDAYFQQSLTPDVTEFIWKKRAPQRARLTLWFLAKMKTQNM